MVKLFFGPRALAMAQEAPSPGRGVGGGRAPSHPLSPIIDTLRAQGPKGPERASSQPLPKQFLFNSFKDARPKCNGFSKKQSRIQRIVRTSKRLPKIRNILVFRFVVLLLISPIFAIERSVPGSHRSCPMRQLCCANQSFS